MLEFYMVLMSVIVYFTLVFGTLFTVIGLITEGVDFAISAARYTGAIALCGVLWPLIVLACLLAVVLMIVLPRRKSSALFNNITERVGLR